MTKVNGKGNILTAIFAGKTKSLFPALNKKGLFAGTNNLVLLSIQGNEYCQGDFLGAIVKNSLAHEFSTFLIADEIYWHNLKSCKTPSLDEQQALKQQAIDLGDKYIEEQLAWFLMPLGLDPADFAMANAEKSISEKLASINKQAKKHNFEIIRWRDWAANLPDKDTLSLDKLLDLYSSDEVLKNSVNSQAKNFARRHVAINPDNDFDLLYLRSQGYLREESFYIMWLGAYLNYNFVVYPGDMPKPFIATKDYFVKKMSYNQPDVDIMIKVAKPELLVNWLHVNFMRKHAPNKAIKEVSAPPTDVDAGKAALIALNTGNMFFGKFDQSDKSTLNAEPLESNLIKVMGGVAKVVVESDILFEVKENFIKEFIERLSAESSKVFSSYSGSPRL